MTHELCILVHPGSFFTSAKSQIDRKTFMARLGGLMDDLDAADGLIVIDGALSDGVPVYANEMIAKKLNEIEAAGGLALRLWGDDAGQFPFLNWQGHGSLAGQRAFDGQMEVATAIASHHAEILNNSNILLCGAWATHDGTSGCVNSVKDALVESGKIETSRIIIADSCIFEDDLDELEAHIELGRDLGI
ncbi:hypothetical protein ACEUZ9_000435 [Paracoccus litorisediminis]|uniref:hypothetical protein n=1 Tax=Paracoccus litorisediminis TaxID=2006130 RepID=UPI00372FEA8E